MSRSPNQNVIENNIEHNRVGRIIQEVIPKEVETLFDSLSSRKSSNIETKLNETLGRIRIKFNKENDSFSFIFPNVKFEGREDQSKRDISISKNLLTEIF